MEVWVLEWSYPYDNETNVSLWSTQGEAQAQACREILKKIDMDWDLDEEQAASAADTIQDYIQRGQLTDAMSVWSDYQDNYNEDHAQYWAVYSRPILTGAGAYLVADIPLTPYKASSPGATCRGPSCTEHNEYAYADRPDGTYLCHQCSIYQHIFGIKP